jgi:cyclin A
MASQPIITENMRSILIDWIIDVSVHFEVSDETLHLAIRYIDRALSSMKIDKTKLQLLGVTCMKIADVYNEKSKEYYRQENAGEYAYITADEYSEAEVLDMEKQVLNLLEFRLHCATTLHFVKAFSGLLEIEPTAAVLG